MYCKIKTELGWQYPWEIATQTPQIKPYKPLDELFNEKWCKLSGAEKAVQETPVIWKTKELKWDELKNEVN
jgi:hypothetical protein